MTTKKKTTTNKKIVQNNELVAKKKPITNKQPEVIAHRNRTKGAIVLETIFLCIGVLLIGLGGACLYLTYGPLKKSDKFFEILAPIAIIFGILNIVISVVTIVAEKRNNKNLNECIVYNPNTKTLSLIPINNKVVNIELKQFGASHSAFFGMLFVEYRDTNDRKQGVFLGWSNEIEYVNTRLNELKQ